MEIIKNIVPTEKYNIKCPYSMKASRIVVHNTANDATARNEISYMISNSKSLGKITNRSTGFPIRSAELTHDDFCKSRIRIFDAYGEL